MNKFEDKIAISGTKTTSDGYLIAEAFAVRTGIQLYRGDEVGLAADVARVYRPEEEVKDVASVQTFTHAPITLGHPAEMVSADNWAELAKGEVSTEAQWVDGKLKLPLIVKDAEAIKVVEAGTRELSAGYTCDLDMTPGTTPEGEAYDAVQRNIKINHLAIVPKGRAGSEFRIGDGADSWGASPVSPAEQKEKSMTLRTITVDGLSVETTDAGAQAIEKLQNALADANNALGEQKTAFDKDIEKKEEELGEAKAKLKKAEDAQLKPEDVDKLVADRAALVASVKAVDKDISTDGLSDAELKKAAVVKVMGDEAVADASDAEIGGMFKAISSGKAKSDKVADAITKGLNPKDADGISDRAMELSGVFKKKEG